MEPIVEEIKTEAAQVEAQAIQVESKEDVQKEIELARSCTPAVIGSVLIVLVLEIVTWWVL